MSKVMAPLRWLDRVLHGLRRITLNLITLGILVVIALALFKATQHSTVPDQAVLVVAPQGHLVYSYSEGKWQRAAGALLDRPPNEVLIRQLTAAIDRAATDPRIKLMTLNLRQFQGGSLTQLEVVARALTRFRKAGKPIYAYADSYSQGDYLLAAQANHVYLNPLGAVLIDGYSDYQPYFKTLLDRLGVAMYAFREGKYKSAVEPFTRSDMSADAREENSAWLQTWWSSYTANVAAGRKLKAAQIRAYAEQLPMLTQTAGGNTARLAQEQGLIDQIGTWHTFAKAVATAAGRSPHSIDYRAYDAATAKPPEGSAAIAVVPIDGMIVGGATPIPGAVVSGPTVAQLDHLLHDPAVHAVVLQVDSPGGSVDASEDIRAAVLRLRAAGKPVVVSMGTLAASGAYMISSAAQTLYAHRTTITADIGVFALVPNFSGALGKLGIAVSGIGTTPTAGTASPMMPLNPSLGAALQSHVSYLYRRFVDQVAQGRKLSFAQVDAAAQGRAWSGEAALRLKLVDHLGGMPEALADAARLAHLKPGSYRIDYLPRPDPGDSLGDLGGHLALFLGTSADSDPLTANLAIASLLGMHTDELRNAILLLRSARPYGYFAYAPVVVPR